MVKKVLLMFLVSMSLLLASAGCIPTEVYGNLDSPTTNETIVGTKIVKGWTFANKGIAEVNIYIDDVLEGKCNYGIIMML